MDRQKEIELKINEKLKLYILFFCFLFWRIASLCEFKLNIVYLLFPAVWMVIVVLIVHYSWLYSREDSEKIPEDEKAFYKSKYHNNKIYEDFKYFYTVTFAILGAIGTLVYFEDSFCEEKLTILMHTLAWIQIISSTTIIMILSTHQCSKIIRWRKYLGENKVRLDIWVMTRWAELWIIIAMILVAGITWIIVNLLYPLENISNNCH